ncbi:MAG TPA: hypothetical protein PLR88_08935 [Bacteroidales bacterium]|nr:hypothetical protein [Bacteroidales bacterium]HPT22055.1 hypothetical protein [Bacteroidales bacterium]
MQIKEVLTKQDKKDFIDFPKELYRGDPDWICPLDSGVESAFDPAKNHSFGHGEAIRWLLKDDSGKITGRIAAFIDRVRSDASSQPTGGIGFFEVIDNREAAFTLFDTARDWLKARGMEAMDGPINFGENYTNWGLLVDGFMQQGFGMPYNKKYYRAFFEEYGFKNFFEQYSYHREVHGADNTFTTFPERILKISEWLAKRPGYTFSHLELKNKEKYIKDIIDIYNSTWSVFKDDFTPLDPGILYETFDSASAIIDEELIWFAYFNEKPIAFFVLFPDLNQILKYFNGKMNILNLIRFFYFKSTHKMTRARALVGGVHPSFQNSGIESAIFLHIYEAFSKKPWIKELELSWVGDYNPKMISLYDAIGAKRAKTHITYRYLINEKLPFVRYKDEMAENHKIKHDHPQQK